MRENTENRNSPPREALNSFNTAEVDNFSSNMCKSSIERLLLSNDNLWRASEIDKIKHNSTGYKNLDNILPNRGWPTRGLIESDMDFVAESIDASILNNENDQTLSDISNKVESYMIDRPLFSTI